jgi:hypothetical protein
MQGGQFKCFPGMLVPVGHITSICSSYDSVLAYMSLIRSFPHASRVYCSWATLLVYVILIGPRGPACLAGNRRAFPLLSGLGVRKSESSGIHKNNKIRLDRKIIMYSPTASTKPFLKPRQLWLDGLVTAQLRTYGYAWTCLLVNM